MVTHTDPMMEISARLQKLAGIEKAQALNETILRYEDLKKYDTDPVHPIVDELVGIGENLMRSGLDQRTLEMAKSMIVRLQTAVQSLETELQDGSRFSQMEDEILNADTLGEPKF